MKILQINTFLNSGSTGKIAEGIGQLIIENGWESYIGYGRRERSSTSKVVKIGNKWDIFWHGLSSRLFDSQGLGSKNATIKFVKEIEKINPSIVHLHNIHGYYLNYQILFSYFLEKNIPVVWTLHDCWPITGHCAHFDYIGCEKWKTNCYKCPQKKEYPKSYLADRSYENFLMKSKYFNSIDNLTMVAVSKWISEFLPSSFLFKKSYKIIYNGIDVNLFTPKNFSSIQMRYNLKGFFVILGVASDWSQKKGINDFAKLSKIIDGKTKIILVGVNKRHAKKLPSNIITIKKTESISELSEVYSLADLYVNPTYEDNFPTTNLEALSCGTPVLTYKTGGSIESVDEQTGFIVEKGDLSGIIKAVEIVKNKGKENYSYFCRKKAKENYNKDVQFNHYIELYKDLLGVN